MYLLIDKNLKPHLVLEWDEEVRKLQKQGCAVFTVDEHRFVQVSSDGDSLRIPFLHERNQAATEFKHGEWIEWEGGSCPVDASVLVEIRRRDGSTGILLAGLIDWRHISKPSDVISYRVMR